MSTMAVPGPDWRTDENLLQLALDVGRVGSFRRDCAAGLTFCGPGTRELSGFAPGTAPITDAEWLASILPEDRERIVAETRQVYAQRISVAALHYRFRHPTDGVRHMETRSAIEYDDAGHPLRSLGVAIDVTERKKAEVELQAREEILRLSLDAGRVASYRRDLQAGVMYCEPALRELLGLQPGEGSLTNTEWMSTWLPDQGERLRAELATIYAERREIASLEYSIRHPRKGVRHIEARSRVEYDAAGQPLRSVGVCIDVTEQRLAEAELRSSQELLRLSLEAGRIGSFRRDYATRLIHCEAGLREIVGFPAGDEPIPDALWFSTWLPEDRDRLKAKLQAVAAERRETSRIEYRIRHPARGVRHLEARSRIEYDAEGRPVSSVGVVIDITERRQAEARIAHLAHHDPLTDLPNRTLFRARLDEALVRSRRGERFALCCVDLDLFKEVNDTLGHAVGDALLQAVGRRLNDMLRPTDALARLGGDEFAVIQSKITQSADAAAFAQRLIAALSAPFAIEAHHVSIGASIGIALAPEDGTDPGELLRKADMALHDAKAAGRGRSRFFDTEMEMRLQARRALETDLRRAVDQSEFEVFYQPLVRIRGRSLCGFEALLRWRHPARGLVPPDRFIPLAEATGLIVPIGRFVLRQACRDAARWPGRTRVAVNLSAIQFAGDTLVDEVRAALDESGLPPGRLELEITETAMLQETEATLKILHQLKSFGIGIAMDDFGTGYSSLSYLQRFPFDKVKIDRSFIANLGKTRESASIVRAVIDLCSGLEMRTTAEGVESETQLEALAQSGCAEAQGYLFSRPRPVGELAPLFAEFRDHPAETPSAFRPEPP